MRDLYLDAAFPTALSGLFKCVVVARYVVVICSSPSVSRLQPLVSMFCWVVERKETHPNASNKNMIVKMKKKQKKTPARMEVALQVLILPSHLFLYTRLCVPSPNNDAARYREIYPVEKRN